jgi:hypothetical protein
LSFWERETQVVFGTALDFAIFVPPERQRIDKAIRFSTFVLSGIQKGVETLDRWEFVAWINKKRDVGNRERPLSAARTTGLTVQ